MRWLFWASLLLVLSLLFGFGLFAYAMYALLGVLLFSRLLTRIWVHNLAAERECNRQIAQIGDTIAVVITVENKGVLPIAWVLLEDVLPTRALLFDPPSLRVVGRRLRLMSLGSRGRNTLYYQLECNRRGFYQIGPLVMETGDLFGLHRRFRVASQPHFLLVYPQVIPLLGYDISSRRPIGEIRISNRIFEDPTRIAGVRPYQPGDPLNRINWRATARTGQLHSKIYEPSTIAGLTIVMDFHTDSYPTKHEPMRSELAITCAASLANAVYEMGQQVGLVSNCRDAVDRIRHEGWDVDLRSRKAAQRLAGMHQQSDRLRPVAVETRRGSEQLIRILETLARAELTDGLTYAQLIQERASRLPRDATVVAILTGVSDETALALGNLRRSGFAVSAILNLYDGWEFGNAAGALVAQGITVYHLSDENAVAEVCRNQLTLGAGVPRVVAEKPLRITIE
jgi:uncharacterized repeat protein (TIGR01451 family)